MEQDREAQFKEISERYIQELQHLAKENMSIATQAYFELIKILLSLSFAALPILATVLGLKDKYVPDPLIPFLIGDVLLFLLSILLGICAKGFSALAFRNNALEGERELVVFLKMTDLNAIEEYFLKSRGDNIRQGIYCSPLRHRPC